MTSGNGSTGMVVRSGLEVAKPDPTRAFEPRDIGEGYDLAKLLVESGLMPRGVTKPAAAFAIIAAGRELGLTAMQSLRSIHIIEGKPTLSADLVCALVKSRSDVCQYFRLVESTDKIARYETHRRGEPAPTSMSFSIEDAQRAGVTGKDNWKKYPAAMLRARCITALARAVYPDLAMGVYDSDSGELDAVDMGPAQVVKAPRPDLAKDLPTAKPVDEQAFTDLCTRVDAAETTAALNAIAKDSTKAAKSGAISSAKLEALKAAVTSKRALVGATKPPPSEPKAQDDGPAYDMNEAEAEAMAAQYDE